MGVANARATSVRTESYAGGLIAKNAGNVTDCYTTVTGSNVDAMYGLAGLDECFNENYTFNHNKQLQVAFIDGGARNIGRFPEGLTADQRKKHFAGIINNHNYAR